MVEHGRATRHPQVRQADGHCTAFQKRPAKVGQWKGMGKQQWCKDLRSRQRQWDGRAGLREATGVTGLPWLRRPQLKRSRKMVRKEKLGWEYYDG